MRFFILVNPCFCFSYLHSFIFLTFFFSFLIFCSVFPAFRSASLFIFFILRSILFLASFISVFYFTICFAIVSFSILRFIFSLASYFFNSSSYLAIISALAFQFFFCFSILVSFFLVSVPFLRFWLVFLGVGVFLAIWAGLALGFNPFFF